MINGNSVIDKIIKEGDVFFNNAEKNIIAEQPSFAKLLENFAQDYLLDIEETKKPVVQERLKMMLVASFQIFGKNIEPSLVKSEIDNIRPYIFIINGGRNISGEDPYFPELGSDNIWNITKKMLLVHLQTIISQ